MIDSWVNSLANEVGMPERLRYSVSWERVETAVGTQLPDDYKNLVNTFGPGIFDRFIIAMVPGVENPNIELNAWIEQCFDMQKDFIDEEIIPWPYPEPRQPGCLLAWGRTASGDFLYWKTGGEPQDWTVVVQPARGADFFEFSGSASEFVTRFLRGEVKVSFIDAKKEGPIVFQEWDGRWQMGEGKLEFYGELLKE